MDEAVTALQMLHGLRSVLSEAQEVQLPAYCSFEAPAEMQGTLVAVAWDACPWACEPFPLEVQTQLLRR